MNEYTMIPVVGIEPEMIENIDIETSIINQQQKIIYVPIASYDNYGIVKIGPGLTLENGVLTGVVGYSTRITKHIVDYSNQDVVTINRTDIEPIEGIQVNDFIESINDDSYGVVSKVIKIENDIVSLSFMYDKPDGVLYVPQQRTNQEQSNARKNINALAQHQQQDNNKIAIELLDGRYVEYVEYENDVERNKMCFDVKNNDIKSQDNNGYSKILKNNGIALELSPQIFDCTILPNQWLSNDNDVYRYYCEIELGGVKIPNSQNPEVKYIELYNDNPKEFVLYGYCIESLTGFTRLKFLALDKPENTIILKVGLSII